MNPMGREVPSRLPYHVVAAAALLLLVGAGCGLQDDGLDDGAYAPPVVEGPRDPGPGPTADPREASTPVRDGGTAEPVPEPEVTPEPTRVPTPDPLDRTVLEVQGLLADLGYPVGPVDGVDGAQTRRALCAWRRLEGAEAGRDPLRQGELEGLRGTTGLPSAPEGRGATVDRTCQALYYRDGGEWRHTHRASTGLGGLPNPGSYTIAFKRPGWHTSTLYPAPEPNMYNAMYFSGPIAIHGSNLVPPHPASAGCVRVTPESADQLFADLSTGDPVVVIGSY